MAQTRVQDLLFMQEPCGGDPSKRARAHCHTQAWARYRGLVESTRKYRVTVAGQPIKVSCS
jgi:hypothetical protein